MSATLVEWIVSAVIIPDFGAKKAVAGIGSMCIDRMVFIWRHSLGCELATDPIGRLSEHNPHSLLERSKSGCAASKSAADNGNITFQLIFYSIFIKHDKEFLRLTER
jgi:hypothetical protein